MAFEQQSLEWYYTLRAMDEAIENKRHHALFVLNNYRNIQDKKYPWIQKPINEKSLIRTIHADVISQVFKNIESLFTIINVGLTAYESGIFNHASMKECFFDTKWNEIQKNIDKLQRSSDNDFWKWALWISNIDEAKKQMNLNKQEVEILSLIYKEYLERASFFIKYAIRFWNLYKPVRNAFSHTLRIIPSPNTKMEGIPKGYNDVIFVLDKKWKNKNPVKIPVLTGPRPLKVIAELIMNLNLFEESIIKNHTISIQAQNQRLIPVFAIGREDPKLLAEYRKLLKKLPKFPAIEVNWKYQADNEEELKPQFELYESFKEKLGKLSKSHPFTDFATFFFPREKNK